MLFDDTHTNPFCLIIFSQIWQIYQLFIIVIIIIFPFFLMRSLTRLLPRFALSLAKQANLCKPLAIPLVYSVLMKPQANFSAHKNIIKSSYNGDGFYVEQMLTGCLAIYSYYIESNGQAIIIDPQNDISLYSQILTDRKAKLKGVFLTHYHADYIAGHKQLAKTHKCLIYMGPKALQEDGLKVLKDRQHIKLGNIELQLLHTPGHTQQSSCILVHNKSRKQDVVFSGDTVFLNEVGRPDLAVKSNLTAKDLACLLYDSIQKFKQIDDNVRIYPGHGSGSSCGKAIGAGDFCEVGTQKKNNYALKDITKQKFVQQVLNQMPNPPAYFGYNARLNKFEPFDYQQAYDKCHQNLSLDQFIKLRNEGVLVIDVRDIPELKTGVISGASCIAFKGAFATWVGTLIDPLRQIVIFGDQQLATDSIKRLLRIGYTHIRGYAKFSMEQWKNKKLPFYTPQFVDSVFIEGKTVLDVRKPQQWKSTGIADTENVFTYTLTDVLQHPQKLEKQKKYVIHCRGGYRARIAYSILKPLGYDVVVFPHSVDKIQKFKKFQ